MLANLTPEQRQRVMELRKQNQQVLGEMAEQKLLRAVYSERQLEEVLVDFWFNHFNVFAGKGPTRIYLAEYERDTIRPHVLGNFRELLGATAHSPAMLFYLDNWQSSDPDASAARGARRHAAQSDAGRWHGRPPRTHAARRQPCARRSGCDGRRQMSDEQRARALQAFQQRQRRGINENYARELMELHTLGVGGGYTQQDIIEVAKAFTGWTIQQPRRGGGFEFDERRHVKGPKNDPRQEDRQRRRRGRRGRARSARGASVDRDVHRHQTHAPLRRPTIRRRRSSNAPPRSSDRRTATCAKSSARF